MTDTALRLDSSQPPAARLGAELREARGKLGWDLAQLAGSLRIRQSYLEAIESGRISDLPGTTYALGFVRAYATALGLPGEDAARRFRAEAEQVHGKPALRFPVPVPRRGVPAGALMLLGLLILAGAYGGWYWVTAHRATPVETVPPIPDRLAAITEKPAPSPQVASILPSTAPPAPAPPAATPLATAPLTAPSAAGQGAVQVSTPPATATPSTPPPTASPTTQTAPQPAPPTPGTSRIVVKVTADAWLTVKPTTGPAVLNKMMHAGDTWSPPADTTGLLMTTGNAGATIIEVDGAPIPVSLGGSGAVRRNLPLDADALKSGTLPPAPVRAKPKPPTP
jgi:cytoskeleton protein RodZ